MHRFCSAFSLWVDGFTVFFSRSFRWTELDQAAHFPSRRNIHSRAVNTAWEDTGDLVRCFQTIGASAGHCDPSTVGEARGFVRRNSCFSSGIVSRDHATCGHSAQPAAEEEHPLRVNQRDYPAAPRQHANNQINHRQRRMCVIHPHAWLNTLENNINTLILLWWWSIFSSMTYFTSPVG